MFVFYQLRYFINMKILATFIFLLILQTGLQAQQLVWPNNKKAVIVLTYDDALLSQLNVAVPQLEAAHLKATFFLTGDINRLTIDKWRALSKKGFEMGNHTIFHPCLSADDNPVHSENYTPYSIIREIDVMNHFLYAVDGKTLRTYAYPCTETTVGGKNYVDTLRKYGLVKYARIGGDIYDAVIKDFKHLDPLQIPSYGLEDGTTGDALIAFVKKVQQSGGLGVIMMHGIGSDYITISAAAHQQLITYLKNNRDQIWVPTFMQAMDYVFDAKKQAGAKL